jgi:hypothetical protein
MMDREERLLQLLKIFCDPELWLRKMNKPSSFDLTREDIELILDLLIDEKKRTGYGDDRH